ncbi:MAG: phospho-N-acetylmuramoyl-pentapeptide-transferase [Lachnospiraceae bacterium]|nr:phospho-N-acetylmuramoyl-pentapeptide-transferase [Lachnospiraceae bacterium]
MIKDTIIATMLCFAITAILCPIGIPMLHRLKFGQYIRELGPQEHQKKSGTPTMGGIMFIIAIAITACFFAGKYPMIIPVAVFILLFGIIGFLDDYLKVVKKQNEGLKVWQKILMQFIITAIFAFYLYRHPDIGSRIIIPFTGAVVNLGWLFLPFVFFVVIGTDNGVNFTDGLDGLCASVTCAVAAFFAAAAIKLDIQIAPIAGAVSGAMMGYLIWNVYPAKVFMGDTGSLALGGFVASFALMTRLPLFIVIVGIIYLIEVLSVILQVGYFKATHGKRLFKMAPIHHHFELCGWKETRVVAVFTVVTIIMCLIAYLGLK